MYWVTLVCASDLSLMVDLQVDLNLPRHRSELPLILQKMLLYIFPSRIPT